MMKLRYEIRDRYNPKDRDRTTMTKATNEQLMELARGKDETSAIHAIAELYNRGICAECGQRHEICNC